MGYTPDWAMTWALAYPFPPEFIQEPAPGKFGNYVAHADVEQRLIATIGLHDFEVVTVVRGYAPAIKSENNSWPAREDAVVGVLARLTITDSNGVRHTVVEVGSEDSPAMNNDGENLKNAASDAYKRCAMRFGVALDLWAKAEYLLPDQLKKRMEQ